MKREVYTITKDYQFDITHKGAPYCIDGTWKNAGEAVEILLKDALGFRAEKDANTPFDEDSDIPELHASVKSPAFTLTSVKLGESFEEVKASYFERTASELTIWGYVAGEELVTYWMNMEEFSDYLEAFGTWEASRKVIRGKKLSNKMLNWFEERVAR